jgi:Heterokaryon incompatibility protein (HET)
LWPRCQIVQVGLLVESKWIFLNDHLGRYIYRISPLNGIYRTPQFSNPHCYLSLNNESILSAIMWKYTYHPLTHPDSIRLLILEPGADNDVVSCSLLPARLSEDPAFEAISYTWGNQSDRETIFVSGASLGVSRNLANALRNFRLRDRKRRFWADAVCINQDDVQERSKQVQIMRDIFSQARKTRVWLGDAMPLDRIVVSWVQAKKRQKQDIYLRSIRWIEDMMGDLRETEQALMAFFTRPWFRRIWVVQEVAVSNDIEMHFGTFAMSFGDLSYAIQTMLGRELVGFNFYCCAHSGLNAIALMNSLHYRSRGAAPKRIKIDDILLRSARDFAATEPRDKIFALLGLPLENCYLMPRVNYNIPTRALYKAVIQSCLEYTKSFKCLAFGNPAFPSWLTDLEDMKHSRRLLLQCDQFKAGGDETCEVNFIGAKRDVLALSGCSFDSVTEILSYEVKEVDGSGIYSPTTDMDFEWWGRCQERMEALMPYPTMETMVQLMWRLRICDMESLDYGVRSRVPSSQHYETWMYSESFVAQPFCNGGRLARGQELLYEQKRYAGLASYSTDFSFAVTKNGYAGWIPKSSKVGDRVCVVAGGQVPFILRELPDSLYQLIGECYIHGIMDGEALKGKNFAWETILIK